MHLKPQFFVLVDLEMFGAWSVEEGIETCMYIVCCWIYMYVYSASGEKGSVWLICVAYAI